VKKDDTVQAVRRQDAQAYGDDFGPCVVIELCNRVIRVGFGKDVLGAKGHGITLDLTFDPQSHP